VTVPDWRCLDKEVNEMRNHWIWLGLFSLAAAVVLGCSGADAAREGSVDSQGASQSELDAPAAAISQFLDAVRRGDDEGATAMFTPVARRKAKEIGLAVAPRGSDTADYVVGRVQYLSKTTARVDSSWSDLAEDGQRHSDTIQWTVHEGPEGWRVAGMTAAVFPGERPLELDFENPEEMLRKLDEFRAEMARRSQTGTLQANHPEVSEDSFRR
jgi:hypothetical protein